MEKREEAVSYKHNGMNCCQAVLAAYAGELGMPVEVLTRLGAGFGAGMGGMDGTCGALCGAEMVLGLKNNGPVSKQAKALHADFTQKSRASICRDLKSITDGKPLCSCDDCVRHAVDALEAETAAHL